MKTISLEVEEQVYKDVINFLRLLPKESFRIMEEDSDKLSLEEQSVVQILQARLQAGDESEFEDWETVKTALK